MSCGKSKVAIKIFALIIGDAVVLWVERRDSDQQVAGLTPARALLAQQP